jgi:hypothetical protein
MLVEAAIRADAMAEGDVEVEVVKRGQRAAFGFGVAGEEDTPNRACRKSKP